ncbi:MAG: hypothetical protein PHP22_08800 [Oscillospiraceae bacterium]|nr:hypothetical protein [Oscillospiraceae bacterium]
MKKSIIRIILFVVLILVIVAIVYIYKIVENFNFGKSFVISVEEGEVIDYNAVNQDRYINGAQQMWFDMIKDTERKKLVSYMKKNNYIIVPGKYDLRQGYKFKDIQEELEFEEKT